MRLVLELKLVPAEPDKFFNQGVIHHAAGFLGSGFFFCEEGLLSFLALREKSMMAPAISAAPLKPVARSASLTQSLTSLGSFFRLMIISRLACC